MIDRRRIIGFRLTEKEVTKYWALVGRMGIYTWSDLVRDALREYAERHPVESPITALNSRSAVKHDLPLFAKRRPAKKGKLKSKRKPAKVA